MFLTGLGAHTAGAADFRASGPERRTSRQGGITRAMDGQPDRAFTDPI